MQKNRNFYSAVFQKSRKNLHFWHLIPPNPGINDKFKIPAVLYLVIFDHAAARQKSKKLAR